MPHFPAHLFDEPDADPDTLANLGPLTGLAGVWQGRKGGDDKPTEDGGKDQVYVEHYDIQPIDPQTNGPQLLYGLRYHTHIVKPGEVETYHDQVGYWLWEPATGNIYYTLTIPRAQIAMASGNAAKDAKSFTVTAERGKTANGICSNPFLEQNFCTTHVSMTVTLHDDGSWSYEEVTTLDIKGVDKTFQHTDKNHLTRTAPPRPNPLAAAAKGKSPNA